MPKAHIHILGIAGTFMGSLAQLAAQAGFRVTGCDTAVYPPMSDQLEQAGIEWVEGYSADQISFAPDVFVVGNVVSRGNALIETILNQKLSYISGPQWLSENILRHRWVLGVAGTHGKTTTSSMLAWILHHAGYNPGYLIGGVPDNFATSASLGASDFFVIEADEYDTAFFDKRSKFLHYQPNTLVINNLEFDHADIFADLEAIQKQFHHLLRTVASTGLVVHPLAESVIDDVVDQGCWCEVQTSELLDNRDAPHGDSGDWCYRPEGADEASFRVFFKGNDIGSISWSLSGRHNMQNAVHAIAAARHVGVLPELACEALCAFSGVKRRMECVGELTLLTSGPNKKHVTVYDDFAHHPTAIESTLEGLRKRLDSRESANIIAVIEPRSNTMRLGVHQEALLASTDAADAVFWFQSKSLQWPLADCVRCPDKLSQVYSSTEALLGALLDYVRKMSDKDIHIVVMSNGAFDNMPRRILSSMQNVLTEPS